MLLLIYSFMIFLMFEVLYWVNLWWRSNFDWHGWMKVKFDIYWENIDKPGNLNMLLFIATVLHPRYKMWCVNFILSKAYGSLEEKLKADNVEGVLKRLYNHYNHSSTKTFTDNIGGDTNIMGEVDDILPSQWEKQLEDEENIGKNLSLINIWWIM